MAVKALLIGINYTGTPDELRGCVNDIEKMRQLLKKNGWGDKDITIVSDAHPRADYEPTRDNIIDQLEELGTGAKEGDILIFHYSGHGSSLRDHSGDEVDNRDEAICPSSGGVIKDDELNDIVTRFPRGVRLVNLMDSCHSGSVLDLLNNTNRRATTVKTSDLQCYINCVSGGNDDELSADALIEQKYQGAMSAAWFAMVEIYGFRKVLDILFSNSVSKMKSFRNDMWNWLTDHGFPQRPNISFEGTLPRINPMLRSSQIGGHALRALPEQGHDHENERARVAAPR